MEKKHLVMIGAALVILMASDKLKQLPLLNKLPSF